ncbi:hypothetical protein EJV46_22440 [Roseococcus sp. SYP-B2431]|uniref:hypothetical protein n=1 Tax=Roseococcus sp. SYP-B2431 TaxID=2496640 RepID=UPI00103F3037|nr:hypothetical protein [Roseococcus sp. SYP-B2431]TCH96036.1 hypothetical protein EJV46_22440 [Roseococcus sp. SYP-B2431]
MIERALLGALLLTLPAAAQETDLTAVLGQPVLALAQRPEMTLTLRFSTGGYRSALAARLRDPGPPVALAEERYFHGYGCQAEGCRQGGAFLAYDLREERVFLLLLEQGRVRLSVPPNPRDWPVALRPALLPFSPALSEAIGGR